MNPLDLTYNVRLENGYEAEGRDYAYEAEGDYDRIINGNLNYLE